MKIKYLYQLLASHIVILFIGLVIVSGLFINYIEKYVYERKVVELITYGESILQDISERRFVEKSLMLAHYKELLSAQRIHFVLFNRQGEVVSSRSELPDEVKLQPDEWQKLQRGETIIVTRDLTRFDQVVSLVVLPYMINGQLAGGVLLTSPISGAEQMISQINKKLFFIIVISLAVTFILSWLLSKWHVFRIARIKKATEKVAQGDYSVQLELNSTDELGELATAFNEMVKQLEASQQEIERLEKRRRQFMADVSHELKTPLTTIRGLIEGLQSGMIPPEEQERCIQLMNKETSRLIRLVNENLDYEKIRSNQIQLYKTEIPLIDVFEIIKEQLVLFAEEKGNTITIEVQPDVHVFADYDRIVQIIMNITKNSIQFTENGHIILRGIKQNHHTIIEIEDTGIGMDPQEVEQIWERFYKADLSRTNHQFGEFGLGLSIVKQLVKLHEGEIEVESEKGKGTLFRIRFPRKP
ncbi:ATP-binding protein [Aeribacillus pallidus]|uniref:ATP-binding protein n=1 Tax=Aeribacillus pallidus TaxID=33936 RepID=UPI003D1EA8FE